MDESAVAGSEPASRDHHSRWSRGAPARASALASVLVAGGLSVAVYVVARLIATPAGAVSAMLTPGIPPSMLGLRVVLCATLATCGGVALLVPSVGTTFTSAGMPGGLVRRWMGTSAALGMLACLGEAVTDRGARQWSAVLAALLLITAFGVARARRGPTVAAVASAGALLAILAGIALATASTGPSGVLDVVYVLAVSVLLGASIHGHALRRPAGPGQIRDLAGLARRAGLAGRAELLDLTEGPAPTTGAGGSRGPSRELAVGRLFGLVVLSGVVAAAAGAAQLAVSGPRTWFDLCHTASALVVLAQVVAPIVVTGMWSTLRHTAANTPDTRPTNSRTALDRAGAGFAAAAAALTTVAVLLAASRAALPAAPAAPIPGQPLLRPAALGGQHLAVLVTPMRPGPNLVHIGASPNPGSAPTMSSGMSGMGPSAGGAAPAVPTVSVSAGGASVTAGARPGAPGLWAVLDIPAGTHTLTLATGPTNSGPGPRDSTTVPVDVGTAAGSPTQGAGEQAWTGPDGPECASAALGAVIASATPVSSCPADRLSSTDAASLSGTVAFLAHQRLTHLGLVSDGSTRSRAAAAVVREQAARWRLTIDPTPVGQDSVLVVTGWDGAPAALHAVTERAAHGSTGGAILAPWLAVAPILGEASSETVPLTFNPQTKPVREYAATLRAVFPGETPSPAGYLAWAAGTDPSALGAMRFYGAAQVNVPMGGMMDFDMNPDGVPGDWYPSGTIVPID